MNQSDSNLVSSAEQILGYHFRKPSRLKHALTHASYSNGTISYQRLEFVGDAVLNLAMTNYFNVSYKNLRPGDISMLRSANLTNEKLARSAVWYNIYPLVQINCPKLDKMVKKFTKAVKQEPEDKFYGGSTIKAPKVLADVVEAIAAAIYQDCNNLDIMWEIVKRLLEPLITPDNFAEHKMTALTQFCEKNGKVLKFVSSRKGKTTIFEVLVDNEKVGYGSSKNKCIAKLNAARNALKKLNGEKSKNKHIAKLNAARDALKKLNGEKSKYIAELNVARDAFEKLNGEKSMYIAQLNAARDALEKLNGEKSKYIAELNAARDALEKLNGEKSKYIAELNAARDALEKLNGENSMYIAKLNAGRDALEKLNGENSMYIAKLNTARDALEKMNGEKPMYIAELNAARDALEKLNREKSNLLTKLHKEIEDKEAKHKSVLEDERDKIEEVRKDAIAKQKLNELWMKRDRPPPEYQSETERINTEREKGKGKGHVADPPQHQPPPGLTASPRPAPGYNVTVEGRERRERRLPCCGIDNGWLLFILGFFLGGIPWCIGAIICYSRVDYRKKPGYIGCTIAVGILAIICWVDMINNWSDKKELMMIGDFMLL